MRTRDASSRMEALVDEVASALRLRRNPLLPLSSSDGSGARIRGKITLPSVSFVQVATYVWIVASLLVALLGYTSCLASSSRASLICTASSCTFERHLGATAVTAAAASSSAPSGAAGARSFRRIPLPPQAAVERVTFPREYLIGAQTTRTRNGEPVEFDGARRRRRQRVLGHSFLVKYRRRASSSSSGGGGINSEMSDEGAQGGEETAILFTRHNIGRKRARRQAAAINRYARGEVDFLDVAEYKRWTAFGVLMVVFGLVSAAFALLVGDLGTGGRGSRGEAEGEDETEKDR